MSTDIGFASQTPSLPKGGGSGGLGETFTPDLSTGTGTLVVPLDLPNGPNDIAPHLSLHYDSGGPNGPFGLGWSIPLPRISRSTIGGLPRYDDTDTLVLEGSGPLVRTAGGLRPEVESGEWRIAPAAGPPGDGLGFVATDRTGTRFHLGTTAASRIPGLGGVPLTWLLDRIEDNLGETATFTWEADEAQRYLATVAYGPFEVRLDYEPRPDALRWSRAGFVLVTDRRCRSVELHLASPPAGEPSLVRRWTMGYSASVPSQASLLATVTLTGVTGDGTTLDAPPLRLEYTAAAAPALRALPPEDEGAAPPGLGGAAGRGTRVELIDWTGNGVADLVEVGASGVARVWPNRGGRWGRPFGIGELPQLADPTAAVGLIDLDGNGYADLVRADVAPAGYQPRSADGLERPVRWSASPSVAVGSPAARLVDLDGDGIGDLMWSTGTALLLARRTEDAAGWVSRPDVVPRRTGGPPTDLSDPHVHVADMTGDGTLDVVRADGAGVTYWPYLGHGTFGDAVTMSGAPVLPFDVDPARVMVVDLDGDGCADVLRLDDGKLTWWPNRSGDGFAPPREIRHLPTGAMDDVRVADVLGTGTPALVWSTPLASGRARWFALDLTGAVRPGLLARVDTSIGRVTTIRYTTSAAEEERDRAAGTPWTSRMPVVLPVISALSVADATTGAGTVTDVRYHEGRYDPVLREVCGFGRVDAFDHGDARVGGTFMTRWFHTGIGASGEPQTAAERRRLRAIRGRMYRQEVRAAESIDPAAPLLLRSEQTWQVIDGASGLTVVPRLQSSESSVFEGAAEPVSRITTVQLAWDSAGNVVEAEETSFERDGAPAARLHTHTQYAHDPAGRFLQRPCRVVQTDGAGTVLADTRTEYDGLPFGQVGAEGLVTGRSSLAVPDALAADVYGGDQPDWSALGYDHRGAHVPGAGDSGIAAVPVPAGWWIHSARYARTVDAAGVVHGSITGPLGAVSRLEFEPTGCYPVRVQDDVGNEVTATFDLRTYQPLQVVEPAGGPSTVTFDALARPLATVEPGDSAATPTTDQAYATGTLPVVLTVTRRAGTAADGTELPRLREREFVDGEGRLLQRRVPDGSAPAAALGADPPEIVQVSHRFGARGLLTASYLPYRAPTAAYDAPDTARPHVVLEYDALNRIVRKTRPDGATASVRYLPGRVEETDEAGHLTVRRVDGSGRVTAIEQQLEGRRLTSTFRFALNGSLVSERDPSGAETRFRYDLLGRTLATTRPEASTVVVLDAAGRTVESRSGGRRLLRAYDSVDRLLSVREEDAAAAPVATFTYHDSVGPAPADAGLHTAGGRLVRVEDESGTTVLDYDERGQVASKTMSRAGFARLTLATAYRADGLVSAITYPDGSTIDYEYDDVGRLVAIADVVSEIEYDLQNRPRRVRYANGVERQDEHEALTGRLRRSQLRAPGAAGGAPVTVRDVSYGYDLLGNVRTLTGTGPGQTWTYGYDSLSRLVRAEGLGPAVAGAAAAPQVWTYGYDDAGNLLSASDVGAYAYGEGGEAVTCLTTLGAQHFTYDDRGHVASAPWGAHTVDASGRLRRVALTSGTTHEYTYDHSGRLALNEVNGTRADGTAVTARVWSPDGLVSVDDDGLMLQITDGTVILARRRAASAGGPAAARTTWLHYDHLGSVFALTDGAGQVVLRLRYGPYGQLLERSGAGAAPQTFATGLAPAPRTGPAAALEAPPIVLLGARWYCPAVGRFLSPDPIVGDAADPAAWNAYAYCRNNPTSYVDPTGRQAWKIVAGVLATVAIIALVIIVTILSWGTAAPATIALGGTGISVTWSTVFAATLVGVVAGGVIGGVAAARAGGDASDVLVGMLVGAAVGGSAAFGAAIAGPAVAAGFALACNASFGAGTVAAGAIAGAVSGTINGAAMGFASGFAGGRNKGAGDIMEKVLVGAIIGKAVGAALGILSGIVPGPGDTPGKAFDRLLESGAKAIPKGAPTQAPMTPPTPVNSIGDMARQVLFGFLGKALKEFGPFLTQATSRVTGSIVAQTVLVDLHAAALSEGWDDLEAYVQTHKIDLGPLEFGGGF